MSKTNPDASPNKNKAHRLLSRRADLPETLVYRMRVKLGVTMAEFATLMQQRLGTTDRPSPKTVEAWDTGRRAPLFFYQAELERWAKELKVKL